MHSCRTRAAALTAAILAGAMAGACSGGSPTSPSTPDSPRTFLSIVTTPGDGFGNGFRQYAERSDAIFEARRETLFTNHQAIAVTVRPQAGFQWRWDMRFQVPMGESLRVGAFENVTAYPTGVAGRPGVAISGFSSCFRPSGRFDVRELELGPGDTITRLRLSFQLTCSGGFAPFRGEIGIVPGT